MIIKSSWIATFELSLICSHLQASSSSSRSSCMHVIQPQIRAERRQMHMQRFSKYKAKLQAASASVTHLYSNVSNLVNLSSATIIRMRCSQEVHQIPGKTRSWVDTDCKLITLDSSRGVPHTLQPYSYVRLVASFIRPCEQGSHSLFALLVCRRLVVQLFLRNSGPSLQLRFLTRRSPFSAITRSP
jgi:hypothetical protein